MSVVIEGLRAVCDSMEILRPSAQTDRRCGAGPVGGLLGGKDPTGRFVCGIERLGFQLRVALLARRFIFLFVHQIVQVRGHFQPQVHTAHSLHPKARIPGKRAKKMSRFPAKRAAVLWRRRSFGCHRAAGNRLAERILAVVQPLRVQGRAVQTTGYRLRPRFAVGTGPRRANPDRQVGRIPKHPRPDQHFAKVT